MKRSKYDINNMFFKKVFVVSFIIFFTAFPCFGARSKPWISIDLGPRNKHTKTFFEIKRIFPGRNEFQRKYKEVFDARSFGNGVREFEILLPPSRGEDLELHFYTSGRHELHIVEKNQYHIIELDKKCIRSSVKDPDLKIPWCKELTYLRMKDFSPAQVKHMGLIKQTGRTFKFKPAAQ